MYNTNNNNTIRAGGFEGGFHDDRASRIGAVYKIRDSKATLEKLLAGE